MKTVEELVKDMFGVLDKVESSEEGRLFHPTYISSCRTMDGHRLNQTLLDLRTAVGLPPPRDLEAEEAVCENCNGNGEHTIEIEADRPPEYITCGVCHGTGKR